MSDDEEEDEYFDGDDNDDDDDDDEGDFVPGEEDEEEEDDDDDDVVPLMNGMLQRDEQGRLCYVGDGFALVASADAADESAPPAPAWDVLSTRLPDNKLSTSWSVVMSGPCDLQDVHMQMNGGGDMVDTKKQTTATTSTKPTPRQIRMTWSIGPGHHHASGRAFKSTGDDDGDGKKIPSVVYHVAGHQVQAGGSSPPPSSSGDMLEFQGGYVPSGKASVELICRARLVPAMTKPSAAAAASPAAAAAAPLRRKYNRDDDDDDDDADEGVDYDELIALHEEAGMSVDAIKRRLAGQPTGESPEKRTKAPPSASAADQEEHDDDDDDDDYGF